MRFTADFHIHSHYSRATSPEMNVVSLYKWGQIKGIQVIGTGDFTHPKWFTEMREKLKEAEDGLYTLKKEYVEEIEKEIPASCKNEMRFLLTVEISCIYSKNGRVRKVHIIVGAPSFEVAAKINTALSKIGNLHADGRPILGLDAKELMKIVFAASPDCLFIPAHIWTPHFGVLGSNSGFDRLEECFEELTPQITALETGLSSDPDMNWRYKNLDQFTLVSNSDAHSAKKLGREVNRLNTTLDYRSIHDAVKSGNPQKFLETIEFFPEEGKYHLDGHAGCKVRLTPEETRKNNGRCPKCGKKVTVGVLNRVEALAGKGMNSRRKHKVPFRYLIPLPEVLADILDVGISSKKVDHLYFQLIQTLGSEFDILLDLPLTEIEKASSTLVAEAIKKVRAGTVHINPGYDGNFGEITVFTKQEKEKFFAKKNNQSTLF